MGPTAARSPEWRHLLDELVNDTAANVQTACHVVCSGRWDVVTVSNDGGPWTVTWLTDGPVSTSVLSGVLANINLTHTITCVVTQTQAGGLREPA